MHYHYITLTLAALMALGSLSSSVHANDRHLSVTRDIERRYSSNRQYTKRQGRRYVGGGIYRGEPDEDENEPDEEEPDEDEPNEHGPATYYYGSRVPETLGRPSTHGRFSKRQESRYIGGGIYRVKPDEDENEPDEEEPDEDEPNEHGPATYYYGSRVPATLGRSSTYGRLSKRQGGRYVGGRIYRGEPDEDENEPDEEEPDEDEPNEHGPATYYYGSRVPETFRRPSTYGRLAKRQESRYIGGDIYNSESDENEREPNENERNEDEGFRYGPFDRFDA